MYSRYTNPTMPTPQNTPMKVQKATNSLFKTFDSLDEAEEFAYSRLPVNSQNEMLGILKCYENTMRAVESFDTRS